MPYYLDKSDGLSVSLRVQPRSSRNALEFGPAGELRARVTAPPVDSAANDAVIALLAEAAGVAKSQVRLVLGKTARDKTFLIGGQAAVLRERLERALRA
ncbi:MAG: hypothetical protein JWM80_3545 [Cyanobacteria bacterium RYN_339]|nr:hypothetical protein [Cyanobacteria bacterium RYN_339]